MPENGKLKRKVNYKKGMSIDVTNCLNQLNGVDITAITGISEISALTIYSEVGICINRFKNEKHFTSCLDWRPTPKYPAARLSAAMSQKRSITPDRLSEWLL